MLREWLIMRRSLRYGTLIFYESRRTNEGIDGRLATRDGTDSQRVLEGGWRVTGKYLVLTNSSALPSQCLVWIPNAPPLQRHLREAIIQEFRRVLLGYRKLHKHFGTVNCEIIPVDTRPSIFITKILKL